MHILHIEDFFHPNAGYQVNLLSKLQVEQGHKVTVITSELKKIPNFLTSFFGKEDIEVHDKNFQDKFGVEIIRLPLVAFLSGRSVYTLRIFKEIKSIKPDVIFVHGEDTLIGIQMIIRSLWRKDKLVFDCHMLEMASENRFRNVFRWFYRSFITPIFLKKEFPLIRVVDSDYVEKCLGIPLQNTTLLSFGTDINYFKPDISLRQNGRNEFDIDQDSFVVLYAGKLDKFKGVSFLAEVIQQTYEIEKLHFLIIGTGKGEEYQNFENAVSNSSNEILRLPTQKYLDLNKFYNMSDLVLFPRQCSLSFFEAQSCGIPVLFERNEINEQRASYGNAMLFEYGDINDVKAQIEKINSYRPDKLKKVKENARKYVVETYNYVDIAKKFTDVCQSALNNQA